MSNIINTGLNLMNTAYNGAGGIVISGDAVKGGYFVTDILDNIPIWTRIKGTLCYCEADKKFYQFNGEDWGPTELDALGEAIENEIKRAREEEQKLLRSLGETKDGLAAEVARAAEKEEALELAIAQNTGLINSEEESRKEADGALSTSLNAEIAARQSQVTELQSSINEEVGRATSKEAELSQDLSRTNTQVVNLEQRIVLETVARTDAINEVNSNINTKINAEALSRIETDESLQLQIIEEAANRQEESDSLRNSLSDEIYTARAAESDLERKISNEERNRTNEDIRIVAALNNEISKLDILIGSDNEKSVRTIANEELAARLLSGEAEADFKTLQQLATWLEDHPESVMAINQAIAEEVSRAKKKEQEICDSLNAYENVIGFVQTDDKTLVEAVHERIENEQSRAQKAENELREDLDKEIQLRNDQIVGINVELKREVNRAQESEGAISMALQEEYNRAVEAEEGLSDSVNNETTRAMAAEASLQNSLNAEISLREAQINGLNFSLKEEVNRAIKADADTMQALNKEVEDRIADVKAEANARQQAMAEESIRVNEELANLSEMLNKETSKLDILIGDDGEKSVRTIANEELATQLLSGKADDDFKTLQELAAWIENHPEDVAAINEAIQQLQKDLLKEVGDRTAADNAEARTRAAQDVALNNALMQEIALREAQINGLNFSLKEEVNRAKAAEAAEQEALAKAVSTLNDADNVNKDAIARLASMYSEKVAELEAADITINNTVATEISLREAQINGLNFSLKEEVNRAKSSEGLISTALQEEQQRAIAAEEANAEAIHNLGEADTQLGLEIQDVYRRAQDLEIQDLVIREDLTALEERYSQELDDMHNDLGVLEVEKAQSMQKADEQRKLDKATAPFSQSLYETFVKKERVYIERGAKFTSGNSEPEYQGVYPMYHLNPQAAKAFNPWGSYTKPSGVEGTDYVTEVINGQVAYFSALSSVAQRQNDGNIRVNKTPVNSQDATSKAYVDGKINDINTDINKWTPKKVTTDGVIIKNSETISTIPYSASANSGADENTLVRRRADRGILIELATNNDGSINSQSAINAKYLNERLQGANASEVYSTNYWTIPLRSITGEIKCECSDTSTIKASVNKEYLANKLTDILDQVGEAYNQANLSIGAANDAMANADTALQMAYQTDNLATRVAEDVSQIQAHIRTIETQMEYNFQVLMTEINAIKQQIGMSS